MPRITTLLGMLAISLALFIAQWPLIRTEFASIIDDLLLPYRIAALAAEPADAILLIPIEGVEKNEIADTWGNARSGGRTHEGQDIFAPRGTPVRPAAEGYVVRIGENELGGNVVLILGRGSRGFYYAHLESFGPDAVLGRRVASTSIIGYVGNTGNAETTPPHLHFGVYQRPGGPINPYPLLSNE
jgi:peptidoglycan LD-endopeptidase LytH